MRAGWGEFDIFEVLSREHLRMPRDKFVKCDNCGSFRESCENVFQHILDRIRDIVCVDRDSRRGV